MFRIRPGISGAFFVPGLHSPATDRILLMEGEEPFIMSVKFSLDVLDGKVKAL